MKRIGLTSIAICSAMTVSVAAQTPDPNPAMNNPDRFSWQLFVQVNAPGGAPGRNDVVFETWASNEDTFKQSPSFPPATAPSPKILNVAALDRLAPREPGVVPHVTADGTEEVRRNRVAFDFITRSDNLFHTRAGLARAFAAGRVISFPTDSIEVKANWKPSTGIDPARYHVNSVPNGPAFALISRLCSFFMLRGSDRRSACSALA